MITLADIAKRAGVSVATVSLALRNGSPVSIATRERIQVLAHEMGYKPNPLLASLASKRFRSTVATEGTPLAILAFPSLIKGPVIRPSNYAPVLLSESKSLGYSPKLYEVTNDTDPRPIFRELYHRMTQGIVLTGSMDMATFGSRFDWTPFSVVQCARFHREQPFHMVRPNVFQAVRLVFTRLREHGYRRIGFAMGRHGELMEDDEDRFGASIALEAGYLPRKDQLPVYQGQLNDDAALLAWVRETKPDAVVGFSVTTYWLLVDHGYKVPREMGFAGMHAGAAKDHIGYSGLVQHTDEIARQSVRLLDQLIRNRETGFPAIPLNVLVPSTWQEGETLRNQNEARAGARPARSRPRRAQ
jgi:DNA-binding LacI/PurR family transcriptional regulator